MLFSMKSLTRIQSNVLAYVRSQLEVDLPFPSLRDIAGHFGFSHTTARFHLKALEKKGYIRQRDQRVSDYELAEHREIDTGYIRSPGMFDLVASIPAGTPSTAYDETPESFSVDEAFFGGGSIKALTVRGDSMTGDAISDGDIAMIRLQQEVGQRDILAVRVEGEITLKRIRETGDRVELLPSNPEFAIRSVPAEQLEIIGKLVGIIRKT